MGIELVSEEVIAKAASFLQQGKLVAIPTETVYGLGADATNDDAVAAIFEAKGRPQFNPLIVHCPNVEEVKKYVVMSPMAIQLANHFWPGGLTMVLPRKEDCPLSLLVSAGLKTAAVRIPSAPVAQNILASANVPIAAPSANVSGNISPTAAEHVENSLGSAVDLIVDAGMCEFGLESTIVGVFDTGPVLLRPGAISAEELESVIGHPLVRHTDSNDTPQSPGQMLSHYAPRAKLRMNARDISKNEALLAFGSDIPNTQNHIINLSGNGDLKQAAARLFSALHELDNSGVEAIAVMPIPEHGLGEAINDRLKRAAAPRG